MKSILLISLGILTGSIAAQPFPPGNKNASPEAQMLLAYLNEIDDRHTRAGQHNYNNEMDQYTNNAQDTGGRLPAIWGTDFIWSGAQDPGKKIVEEAIAKHRSGVIVTLMWHAGRPMDEPPF